MAIRFTAAAAIELAEQYKASRHGPEDARVDQLWTDMSRRFPLAAGKFAMLAGTPGAELFRFVHPNISVRKINTAMQKHEDYSKLPLEEETDGSDNVEEVEVSHARVRAPKVEKSAKTVKPTRPQMRKKNLNVDAVLDDEEVGVEIDEEEEDETLTV